MKTRLKINGILIFIATAVLLFLPKLFFRPPLVDWQDDFAEVFGLAFILLGFLWRISARGYKAEHSNQGSGLVKDGPYGVTRNPMYLGIVTIGIGVVLILFNVWACAILIIFFISRYIMLIFQEEKQLISQFGNEYRNYAKSTPRLIPRINIMFIKDLKEILPLRALWVKKEIGSFLATIIGIILIESWEDVRGEGIGTYAAELMTFVLILILFFWLTKYLSIDNKALE
ncbi:MAG: isoprenylcysteine carboxylmethyltransferase family protein [Candidatus Omnitrophota bacterium]